MLEWSLRFSVHNKLIDDQHKELFRLANAVEELRPHEASKTVLGVFIKDFFGYMREHFKDEEAYMLSFNYPLFLGHQRLHEEIIAEMTSIIKETKTTEGLQAKIKQASHKWLVEHILEHDLAYEKWHQDNT